METTKGKFCSHCSGLITEPGEVTGWGGKFCYCKKPVVNTKKIIISDKTELSPEEEMNFYKKAFTNK